MHALGARRFLMLHKHGLLTVGATVAEAFVAMYFFETACMIRVRAQAGGGGLAWSALPRRLDRVDPGFRH